MGKQQASSAVTVLLPPPPVLGFEGQNCEVNVDDCPGNRCLNGGTCVDGVNTYNCQCPPEWTGGLWGCREPGGRLWVAMHSLGGWTGASVCHRPILHGGCG